MLLVVAICDNQGHPEVWGVSGSAKNRPIGQGSLGIERRRDGNAVLVAGEGVPHQDLETVTEEEEHEAIAASEGSGAVGALEGEAVARNAIGGLQSGQEGEAVESVEEPEERRVAVVAGPAKTRTDSS